MSDKKNLVNATNKTEHNRCKFKEIGQGGEDLIR